MDGLLSSLVFNGGFSSFLCAKASFCATVLLLADHQSGKAFKIHRSIGSGKIAYGSDHFPLYLILSGQNGGVAWFWLTVQLLIFAKSGSNTNKYVVYELNMKIKKVKTKMQIGHFCYSNIPPTSTTSHRWLPFYYQTHAHLFRLNHFQSAVNRRDRERFEIFFFIRNERTWSRGRFSTHTIYNSHA